MRAELEALTHPDGDYDCAAIADALTPAWRRALVRLERDQGHMTDPDVINDLATLGLAVPGPVPRLSILGARVCEITLGVVADPA